MKNTTNTKSWVIFGAGNFIFDIEDAINSIDQEILYVVVNTEISKKISSYFKDKIISLKDYKYDKHHKCIFGFISPLKSELERSLVDQGIIFTNLVHKKAYLANSVKIGQGNFIGAGVILGPNSKVGNHNFFNRGSLIGHDVKIQDMNHFGPGSIVCGRSQVGKRCSFGAGSVVNDGIKIISDVTIGSLGAVVSDIDKKGVYVGVPARIIKKGS
jgi:acetyltransferase-like isoleucine patch superfamily enzyme